MSAQAWRVVGASVIGTSHLTSSTPCQDNHLAEIIDGHEEIVLLIAADGAGSAARSEFGSRRACQEVATCIRLFLAKGGRLADVTRESVTEWLETVNDAILRLAEEEGRPARDYACTLLAAVAGPAHTVMFQVGDGAIVFWPRGEDDWCLMTWPQRGEYINTTVFITDARARASFEFCALPVGVDEVAVFTDGIESLVLQFATQSVHSAFFNSMFPALRSEKAAGVNAQLSAHLARYLASQAVCERTDDDKTLLLASRLASFAPMNTEQTGT